MEITLAFVLGMISSGIIAILYDYATRPRLKALIDEARAQGQLPQNPAHEFYHVKVRNLPAAWDILPPIILRILPGPRPAWSCKATIQVFNSDGSVAIQDVIQARWPSQPEPIQQFLPQGQLVNVVDLPKLMAARKVDVHGHDDQPICIALKYEGEPDCYIFTNESY